MVNTLVTHKNFPEWGIGCISKELSKTYHINFGKFDNKSVKKELVDIVNTSNCRTISHEEVKYRIFSSKAVLDDIVILGNEVKEYVGIGWITLRVVTLDDLNNYPRVV